MIQSVHIGTFEDGSPKVSLNWSNHIERVSCDESNLNCVICNSAPFKSTKFDFSMEAVIIGHDRLILFCCCVRIHSSFTFDTLVKFKCSICIVISRSPKNFFLLLLLSFFLNFTVYSIICYNSFQFKSSHSPMVLIVQ